MAKLGLQFHMAPSEVWRSVDDWTQGLSVHVATEHFSPEYRVSSRDESDTSVRRIAFDLRPIDDRAGSAQEFMRRNPDALVVDVGPLSEEGLRESALGAVTADPHRLAAWRTVLKRARSTLHRGAWVLNPWSGARTWVAGHLYTEGAVTLASSGVVLLGAAGTNRYVLGDPAASTATDGGATPGQCGAGCPGSP